MSCDVVYDVGRGAHPHNPASDFSPKDLKYFSKCRGQSFFRLNFKASLIANVTNVVLGEIKEKLVYSEKLRQLNHWSRGRAPRPTS